ncbi:cytochrome P450 [Melanogaster broomeanus]|nr:cytochrome P450 [Melanogaster broomeanus]
MSTSSWPQFCVAAILCAIALDVGYLWSRRKRSTFPLPPGPSPLPIVGNVRGINVAAPWLTYTDWGKLHGDLVYSSFFTQEIIVINSEKVARTLLDQRSNIYSDRPELPTNILFGLDFNTVFMHYGDRWRLQRRLFHQAFRLDAAPKYRLMQQRKSHQLLLDLLKQPDSCFEHLHTYASSIIMSAVYDYETAPTNDDMVDIVGKALKLAVEELRPEVAAMFSVFPSLLWLPWWVPGMGIHKKAAQSRKWARDWMDSPFEYVLERLVKGTAGPSMVSDALHRMKDNGSEQQLQAIKETSATAFGAASETTASMLQVFVLAMVLFPDVQKKAQSVIDSVVGTSRLPTWDDRSLLKYIDAVLRETLRWHPILPLSTPHATSDTDVYEGYYIPKGATIMPNIWCALRAMSHNEEKYPEPFDFIPERFLTTDGNLNDDTVGFAFGFGRRICVGRYVADASLWYAISGMLALFNFSKAKDSNGRDVDFEPQWSSGIAIHPHPFPFEVTPRQPDMDIENLQSWIRSMSN